MRLCYLAYPYSIHTRRWLEFFAGRGHDVHLLSLFREPVSIENVTVHHVFSHAPDLLSRSKLGKGLLSLAFLAGSGKRLLQEIQPDVLAAHSVALYGWLAAAMGHHPLALHLHGGDVNPERGALRFPRNLLTPRALHQADLVTAQSLYLLQIAQPYLRPGAAGVVARLGVDLSQFKPDPADRAWKQRLGLDGHTMILSPRPFWPVYNIETIVAAMPHLLARLPEARLVLLDYAFGKPDLAYRARIMTMIADLGLRDVIQLLDQVPHAEMASLLRSADIVVSMSLSEGFSVVVLEAMACGTPLVLSRIPHIDELIVEGINALTVPTREPDLLADAIVRICEDKPLRQAMTEANLDVVRTHASFEAEMKKVEGLYERLVHNA